MSYMGVFYEKEREQIRKIAHEEALAVFAEKVELEKERIEKEAVDTVLDGMKSWENIDKAVAKIQGATKEQNLFDILSNEAIDVLCKSLSLYKEEILVISPDKYATASQLSYALKEEMKRRSRNETKK